VTLDIGDEAQAERFVEEIQAKYGRIDALVNNAAASVTVPVVEGSRDDWRQMVGTNVLGTLYCTHAALSAMRAQGSGHIVNVSSIGGRRALGGIAVYGATKHAITGFTEALRQELAGTGIRVTLIEPGTVLTEMTEEVLRARGTPPSAAVTPSSIADAIVFALAQPESVSVAVVTVLPSDDERPW
jgi:NADP-dependent 3-hydroxy acid dehydrogenase YdfG